MIKPDWPVPPQVRAVATERDGGVSSGAYASLNLGSHVGDVPAAVTANRRRLARVLELPAEPAWLDQVHGTRIIDLDREPPGEADGAVTSRPDRVCAVLTADCLPVLFASQDGARIGAAHAGWRGLLGGVLPAAVARMDVAPNALCAWLGPAIGPTRYEVGTEVYAPFVALAPRSAQWFVPTRPGHWLADLYALARASLEQAGVTAIYGGGSCTFTEEPRSFAHRRAAPCGRMATLIWRAACTCRRRAPVNV
jgi:YfiH family protein